MAGLFTAEWYEDGRTSQVVADFEEIDSKSCQFHMPEANTTL